MTDNTTAPGGEELDKILKAYADVIIEVGVNAMIGNPEQPDLPNGMSLKAALQAYILAEVLDIVGNYQPAGPYTHRGFTDLTETSLSEATENLRISAKNELRQELRQAAIARFGKGGNRG